jgi:phage gp16-like protein
MLSRNKIALIHIAKNKLKLADENYRLMLKSFGVTTSKDLNDNQFKKLMDAFASLGFKSNMRKIDNQQIWGCSPLQKKKIIALWLSNLAVRDHSISALQNFIFNIVKKNVAFISQRDVEKIINAINHLR